MIRVVRPFVTGELPHQILVHAGPHPGALVRDMVRRLVAQVAMATVETIQVKAGHLVVKVETCVKVTGCPGLTL